MKSLWKMGLVVLVVACFGALASADITFSTQPGDPGFWVQINPTTWVAPAHTTQCGNENEPSCEPNVYLQSSVGFAGNYHEYKVEIMEPTGGISDEFFWITGAPVGYMGYWSDPGLHGNDDPNFMTDLGPLCGEDYYNGAVCTLGIPLADADHSTLFVTLASDGEYAFDPFHAGYDTSDGISFHVPEPSSMALLGFGLVGLFRRLKK